VQDAICKEIIIVRYLNYTILLEVYALLGKERAIPLMDVSIHLCIV
jgi:hypothetical protein